MRLVFALLIASLSLIAEAKVFVPKDKAVPAIGQVKSLRPNGMLSVGSCSLIDDDHVLSCCHVISDPRLTVIIDGVSHSATVVAMDTYHDWSILRLDTPSNATPLKASNKAFQSGDKLFGFGYGKSYGYTVLNASGGVLKGLIVEGDSGGPIFNSDGYVVGVCTEKVPSRNESRGFGIGKLKSFIDRWVDSGETLKVVIPEG